MRMEEGGTPPMPFLRQSCCSFLFWGPGRADFAPPVLAPADLKTQLDIFIRIIIYGHHIKCLAVEGRGSRLYLIPCVRNYQY